MNVREALEKLRVTWNPKDDWDILSYLTPIIERALQAAYDKGYVDEPVHDPASGITAGVAAMVEGS